MDPSHDVRDSPALQCAFLAMAGAVVLWAILYRLGVRLPASSHGGAEYQIEHEELCVGCTNFEVLRRRNPSATLPSGEGTLFEVFRASPHLDVCTVAKEQCHRHAAVGTQRTMLRRVLDFGAGLRALIAEEQLQRVALVSDGGMEAFVVAHACFSQSIEVFANVCRMAVQIRVALCEPSRTPAPGICPTKPLEPSSTLSSRLQDSTHSTNPLPPPAPVQPPALHPSYIP